MRATTFGYIAWVAMVGPGARSDEPHTVSRAWDLLARDLVAMMPFDLAPDERMAVGETVWVAIAINGMQFAKVPVMVIPAGGGPSLLGFPYLAFNEMDRHPLLVRQSDRVRVIVSYEPDSFVRTRDDPRPAPVPLTRPIELRVLLRGEVLPPSGSEGTP